MYSRILKYPSNKSVFLFGPRGTGKFSWVQSAFPHAVYLDLLASETYLPLLANPQRLSQYIPLNFNNWIIIDEVQKIPELLDEVHRLIEKNHYKFILTGSSARKLKRKATNLLAGRALTLFLHPLTHLELDKDFDLQRSLKFGQLPLSYTDDDPQAYLDSYIYTYLQQEIQQEGLTRNLGNFSRFLETASFSQGKVLNMSAIARDSAVHRKVVENYFSILQDLLLAEYLPVFTKKSKRRMLTHPKFYLFDAGIYRVLRPSGPLDRPEEIAGTALETLFYQELRALNHYLGQGKIYYWKTAAGQEVDFIFYGQNQILAFEIKHQDRIRSTSTKGLKAFLQDYPSARGYLVYLGDRQMQIGPIQVIPFTDCLKQLPKLIAEETSKIL